MQKIIKTNTTHRTASFVILEPETIDFNGQVISEEEIIKTAHEFMLNLQEKYVNIDHTSNSVQADVQFVESFILPTDFEDIKKGSWIVAFKFSEEKWEQVQNGNQRGEAIYFLKNL